MKIGVAIVTIAWLASATIASGAPQAAPGQGTATKATPGVDWSKLPAPVRATIEAETKNATVKHIAKETEKGRVQYEVETLVNGKSRDLLVGPSGTLLEVEEAIDVSAAPAPVRDALEAKGTVLKLESVHRDARTTYEAQVRGKNGKTSSVALDARGRPIK